VVISCGYGISNWSPSQIIDPSYNTFNFGPIGWGIQPVLRDSDIGVDAYYGRAIGEIGVPTYVYFRLILMKIS